VKIFSVVGNRPQFVKSGPVSVSLRERGLDEVVLHTGQHWDRGMSQVFFDELALGQPRYRLDARSRDVDAMLPGILEALDAERPDAVLVYGDTNSTLAGARAAAARGYPLAHVEAGLRSGDLAMPEERTRIEVDSVAQLLLCPDDRSARTLEREAAAGRTVVVGDVMADVCFRLAPVARERSTILERLGLAPGGYVAATLHRDANVVQPRLGRILAGLDSVDAPVVLAAHPRTRLAIDALCRGDGAAGDRDGEGGCGSAAASRSPSGLSPNGRVRVIEPLSYLDFAALASQARAVVTDSGGVQKEAYWYGVPCVTTRPSTEWVDTVELGANTLVDDDPELLAAAVREARMPSERPPLYGDGRASERVAEAIASLFDR
jgi:UDP-GlcNAc3NAcA epimerase